MNMKFNKALTFGLGLMLAGNISVNAQKVTFNGEQVSLKQAFEKIESVSKYKIAYNATQLDVNKTVTLNQKDVDVLKVLDTILAGTGCTYQINDGYIVITPVATNKNSVKKIEGTVKDAMGEPIIGATVVVKGTTNGTVTDFDGNFFLEAEEGANLEISYIGFQSQQLKAVSGKQLAVTLKEDTEVLEEVVVVGYGVQKKVNLSGAVSAVKASEVIKNRPVTNVASALQGALPGLQISNSNNAPGSGFTFNVRGFTSINGGSPLILADNNPVESISMLNPDDIESVSVLKDAASASIYGARAAYGVVLITTKKAKENEKIKVSYSNNFSFSTPYDLPQKATTREVVTMFDNIGLENHFLGANIDTWLMFLDEYDVNPSKYPEGIAYDEYGAEYSLRDYDMIGDMMEKFGFQQQHNASVQGASGKNAFRVSLGYTKEDGVLYTDKDSYRRTNFSAYWKTDATRWLTLEADVKFANSEQTYVPGDIMRNGLYGSAINFPAFYTFNRPPVEGVQYLPETPKSGLILASPVIDDDKSLRLLGRFTIKPFKGFVINGEYTYLNNIKETEDFRNKFQIQEQNGNIRWNMQKPSSYSVTYNPSSMETINLYGNYNFSIKGHEITLMAGFNQERKTTKKLETSRNGVISQEYPSLSQSTGDLTSKDNISEYATRSLFYRINYAYKGRYLFETNGRYDGSSRFPSDSRFGFFPSASTAWRFSEEHFFRGAKNWMSNGKLRFSVGTIGNQNIGNYDYLPTMSSFLSSWIVGGKQVVSLKVPSLVSPNFTWETVVTYNWGLDFTFWDKLILSFDTYIRNTRDMLAPGMELPSVLGAVPPKENVADLRTKGWELDVKWYDKIGNVDYNIGFNLSDARAKITKFDNNVGLLSTDAQGLSKSYRNGQSIGEIWGYHTEGLYQPEHFNEDGSLKEGVPRVEGYNPNVGDILYKDFNEDGIINKGKDTETDSGDMRIIGNTTPRYHYSINGGLSWRNIAFSFIINGIGKQDLWASNQLVFPFFNPYTGLMAEQLDYWTPDNNNAYFPRMYENCDGNTNANRMVQDRYLLDASYCQIKNLMIQYSIPKKIINKIGISALSFYVSGENLYTFKHTPKGINPFGQESFSYPNMRKISFGLNLTL